MKMTKIAAYGCLTIAALAAASFALPRHVSVERSAMIEAAPEAVLALAASNSGYQAFNPYADLDPALEIELFGPASGVGSGFHFNSKDGAGSQTIAEVTAERVSYSLDLGALGQPTQSISTEPRAVGTWVTWRMESDLGFNPAMRVFGLFMDNMVGPNFELGLEKIADATA
ncbi:MAG: SRPBCC family protein [Pseudomonadota bacterium]